MDLSERDEVKSKLKEAMLRCRSYLYLLNGLSTEIGQIIHWFRNMCELLTKLVTEILNYMKFLDLSLQGAINNTLLLYFTQLVTNLALLINVFEKEEATGCAQKEARSCVVKQIICCLEGVENALFTGNTVIDPSGNFVKWMDLALEKVAEVSWAADDVPLMVDKCKEVTSICEEVLSHAMSIAQVALQQDSKIIRGSSESVYSALSSLSDEVNKPDYNMGMVNVYIDSSVDKLCSLERKVNSAVLKLCLKTFSQFADPLQRVHSFCFNASNSGNVDELDKIVADFDLHVDRIMQIGLFAVNCSSDLKRGIDIRSCLASLEALETELVPAYTSVLMESNSPNKDYVLILKDHWLEQANLLQHFIYLIIDPFAFCQVVYEEADHIVGVLSDTVNRKQSILQQTEINDLTIICDVLISYLNNSQAEFKEEEKVQVEEKISDFKTVLDEVKSASTVLLNGEEYAGSETNSRVLKRCKVLLTVLRRLWKCFADNSANSEKQEKKEDGEQQSPDVDSIQPPTIGIPFLDHVINKGRQLLQERSILYRTPLKIPASLSEPSEAENTSNVTKLPANKASLLHSKSKDETSTSLSLHVTEILSELTNLSSTFSKV